MLLKLCKTQYRVLLIRRSSLSGLVAQKWKSPLELFQIWKQTPGERRKVPEEED